MASLRKRVLSEFKQYFGYVPDLLVRAPGRVNLIGEHTDYNDGFVLPMAIDRAVWIALQARKDAQVVLHSLDFRDYVRFSLEDIGERNKGWGEYVRGVAWALQQAGYRLSGWEGVVAGDVPRGSGLSSSAALELAVARAFAAASDTPWHPPEMAQLCQRAENEWVGVHCGIMDQLISACGERGRALQIDCRSLRTEPVPLPTHTQILVLYSAAPRNLAGSAYNQRRNTCETAVRQLQQRWPALTALRDVSSTMLAQAADLLSPLQMRRARHVVSENERVLAAVTAMRAGDAKTLGHLMQASHDSLRHDYEVSSRELDLLVSLAMQTPGVYGARLTGAGFGGCAIALVQPEAAAAARRAIIDPYRAQTGLRGSTFVTMPTAGAEVWRLP